MGYIEQEAITPQLLKQIERLKYQLEKAKELIKLAHKETMHLDSYTRYKQWLEENRN